MPLVVVAFAVWRILRRMFFILIDIIDFLFPILLQVMRFPLFTLRILGDGLAALLKGIVRFLPVGGDRRAAWRESVSQHWAWLRQKIQLQGLRAVAASRLRKRHGLGVQDLPGDDATHRVYRADRRRPLAADFIHDRDRSCTPC